MVMVVATPHYQFVTVDWLLVLRGKISSGLIANQMFFTRSFTTAPFLQHRLFANISSHSWNHNLYFRCGGWVGQPYIGRQTRQQTLILLSYFTTPERSILTKRWIHGGYLSTAVLCCDSILWCWRLVGWEHPWGLVAAQEAPAPLAKAGKH